MSREMPGSVVNSLRTLVLLVVTTGVITALIWLLRDDVLLAWAKGNPSAQEILAQGGIEALREDQITPGFFALALVAFIGFSLTALVLGSLLAGGHGWARPVLTATAFFGALVAAVCLANNLPTIFVVLAIVLLILGGALIFFLWSRSTSAYLRHG